MQTLQLNVIAENFHGMEDLVKSLFPFPTTARWCHSIHSTKEPNTIKESHKQTRIPNFNTTKLSEERWLHRVTDTWYLSYHVTVRLCKKLWSDPQKRDTLFRKNRVPIRYSEKEGAASVLFTAVYCIKLLWELKKLIGVHAKA